MPGLHSGAVYIDNSDFEFGGHDLRSHFLEGSVCRRPSPAAPGAAACTLFLNKFLGFDEFIRGKKYIGSRRRNAKKPLLVLTGQLSEYSS